MGIIVSPYLAVGRVKSLLRRKINHHNPCSLTWILPQRLFFSWFHQLFLPSSREQEMNHMSPKAVIFKKYGDGAVYKTQTHQVPDKSPNGGPKIFVAQSMKCMYQCELYLPKNLDYPELTVTSELCNKKKEAEQSAAKLALDKLGISLSDGTASKVLETEEEKWEALRDRTSKALQEQFFTNHLPLTEHFRAAVQREGKNNGSIPTAVLSAYDNRILNICKQIDPVAEHDPVLSLCLVQSAAKACNTLHVSDDGLWIDNREPISAETKKVLGKPGQREDLENSVEDVNGVVKAIFIPFTNELPIRLLNLRVEPNNYFMDVIACHLNTGTSQVLISRTLGFNAWVKAPSESRIFFCIPDLLDCDYANIEKSTSCLKENIRASSLASQKIYGDAILAAVGTSYRSKGYLSCEDISFSTYHRMVLSRSPRGNYKICRNAFFVADLPMSFTTRSKWRGKFPREILTNFCHHNRLMEPRFTVLVIESKGDIQRVRISNADENNLMIADSQREDVVYNCEVEVLFRTEELLIKGFTNKRYRSFKDAIQSASLEALSCVEKGIEAACLQQSSYLFLSDMSKSIVSFDTSLVGKPDFRNLPSVVLCLSEGTCDCFQELPVDDFDHDQSIGIDTGDTPIKGTIVSIEYRVYLISSSGKEFLEDQTDFEFEMGTGSVISQLEKHLTQMSIDQTVIFHLKLPHKNLLFAASVERAEMFRHMLLEDCKLEYEVKLLKMTEPPEQRMEAHFKPPLSKQRMEFALNLIVDSNAKTLLDLGCGSGSLFGALLDHETGLEHIAGVDISKKGLIHAAKCLHTKLSGDYKSCPATSSFQSATLYEGSILEFDERVHGFDVATCIEVIEHMQEKDALAFGECVLSTFDPTILLVSTPNYEYNSILQSKSLDRDDLVEEVESKSGSLWRFRNYDHKFEWTRKQFKEWALKLADKYNYNVEFGGVGGPAHQEPGFASQIAVFRQCCPIYSSRRNSRSNVYMNGDIVLDSKEETRPYNILWEWSSNN